ncbi:hypothetical protein GCM10022240_24040 [Microbacterium kribbense]|uniref:Histidine kinase/HSP90-like ATPase domain-containing protein n=1 Tax=Microbacterium kribbense TaxID=433645 RepID=A0ABP7GN21_9MICO
MRIELPTAARRQNIESFTRRIEEPDETALTVVMPSTYFSVHPVVLAATAAAGLRSIEAGHPVVVESIPDTPSARYLDRMALFSTLGVESGLAVHAKEEAGRFVPINVIRSGRQLTSFLIDIVPLLHAETPEQIEPIRYALSELVRNTLEHAGFSTPSVIAAQVYAKTGVISIGVADCGTGIRKSLARSYETDTDLEAVQLAMRPGVTGTTRAPGGTADNAGAGLFFCKSMALTSRNYMVLHSGTGLFKLLTPRNDAEARVLYGDPSLDRATRYDDMPGWPGTFVGIDIKLNAFAEFNMFMDYVRTAYSVDVQSAKRATVKRSGRFESRFQSRPRSVPSRRVKRLRSCFARRECYRPSLAGRT